MNSPEFLPVSRADMASRGWEDYDILLITGDAYVDHPSFGTPVIGRLLESEGYRVALLAQPDWHSCEAIRAMGRPIARKASGPCQSGWARMAVR